MSGRIKNPVVGDLVESTYNYKLGKVIEIDNQFGWFSIKYFDTGKIKRYSINTYGENSSFRRLRDEERADFFLKLENAGLTDYWKEL
jgi:hypothetical protein